LENAAVERIEGIVAGKVSRAAPMPQALVRSFDIGCHFGVRRQSVAATALWFSIPQ
jgi:hypothetical protein